jgi:hypothetical protein
MNKERLERLIGVLEGVKAANKAFDIGSWIQETVGLSGAEACGTTCCACGYAALDPAFQAEGLHLRGQVCDPNHFQLSSWNDEGVLTSVAEFNAFLRAHAGIKCIRVTIEFDGLQDFEAASAFFEIEEEAAFYLFDAEEYYHNADPVDPDDVIGRINEVIVSGGCRPSRTDDED